ARGPPRAATVREIGAADVVPVCMGFAEQVATLEVRHAGDALLSQHAKQTQRLKRGDGWVFTRRGSGPVDGTYAMAGAVHLARTMPAALPPLAVVGHSVTERAPRNCYSALLRIVIEQLSSFEVFLL